MILVTGGAYQGKLEFAKSICEKERPVIAEGEDASLEELAQADIIAHFHLFIKRLMKEEKTGESENEKSRRMEACPRANMQAENIADTVKELIQKNPTVILEITQLGCGVVPMDSFDRLYRETVGRIGCRLAQQAEQVYLVNCGIPKRLK